jgi:hypothetical protein
MMNFKKTLFISLCLFCLSGCLTARQRPAKVVLLPEDKIYTLPAGQEVNILLDGKPLRMTFPESMKIVNPVTLVRQEANLNDKLLKQVKDNSNKNRIWGIIGSLLTAIVLGLGLAFKAKKWFPNVKANVEIK